jgi:formylglycine-generating enzyme required for sulfatase activity
MEDLRVRTHPDEHPGYVRIPEGRYCVGEDRTAITFDKPFWLSKYPVTNSQFALFIDDDGYSRRDFWSDEGWQWVNRDRITAPPYWGDSRFNAPNQPVTAVTFWEAEAFCTWAGGRLPKLEQWEAGACGQHGFSYPWGNEWHDGICNSRETALGTTSPVGIFPRSRSRELGLEDMAGNVWEWCDSIYEEGEVYRVLCGGAFNNGASACMSDHYSWDDPRLANFNVGFRISTCL